MIFRLISASCQLTAYLFIFLFGLNQASAQESNLIVLFGDSISVGENNAFQGSRPGRGLGRVANDGQSPALPPSDKLDDLLRAELRESTVINWGIGGSTSERGAIRVLSDLGETLSDHQADNYYVLILYGTNDFNGGLGPSDTGFNTGLMIDRARSLGYTPVVATLTPRADRNLSSYNSQIVSNANSRNVPIVDLFSRYLQDGQNGLTLLDTEVFSGRVIRLHPNDAGYDVIAQTWFDQFLESEIEPLPIPIVSDFLPPIINLLLED